MAKKKNKVAEAFAAKRANAPSGLPKAQKKPVPQRKIKLLYHGDSPKVSTGFGVVAREVLSRLQATGKYEIHSVGINDKGDPNRYPELAGITHYPLPHYHEDPYGVHKFPEVLQAIKPDLVFTLNDIWVLDGSARNGTKGWFVKALKRFAPHTPWVLYFPVDSRPWTREWAELAFAADRTVVYSHYAEDVLKEIDPNYEPDYISHGVSLERFNVISDEDRKKVRESMGVQDEEFLLGFISRNQPRKNPAAIVEIFKMANEGYRKCTSCGAVRNLDDPKCEYCGEDNQTSDEVPAPLEGKGKCYLHFNFLDSMGLNMHKVVNDNKAGNGIIYNPGHSIPYGLPPEHFNVIFNSLDCHLLTTTAEGFGLTVLEGMACGVPTMATRTTAVTELLEQGGGIPIIPKAHYVFDDAANTRKHIIDPEMALVELGKLYQDWKKRGDERWGPETKPRVDQGLAFANEFTWDKAAKEFDAMFKEAIDERVKITDLYTTAENNKIMLFRPGSAGDVVQTLPAMARLRELQPDAELVCAMSGNLVDFFKDKMPFVNHVVSMENLNDKNPEGKPVRISMVNFIGFADRYEQGTYPFVEKSRPELYCMHAGVPAEGASPRGLWGLTEEEIEFGKNLFESQVPEVGEDDFVVGLSYVAKSRNKAWGEGQDNWDKLKKYIEKAGMKCFIVDEDCGLLENLSALSRCDLIISPDSDILDFLNAMGAPTIALLSPFWKTRVANWPNAKIVSKDDLINLGVREDQRAIHEPSQFMEAIGVGEVFSPILTYKKMLNQIKEEALKKQEEDAETKEEANV